MLYLVDLVRSWGGPSGYLGGSLVVTWWIWLLRWLPRGYLVDLVT